MAEVIKVDFDELARIKQELKDIQTDVETALGAWVDSNVSLLTGYTGNSLIGHDATMEIGTDHLGKLYNYYELMIGYVEQREKEMLETQTIGSSGSGGATR